MPKRKRVKNKKGTKNKDNEQKLNTNMVCISATISIIILNVNGINTAIR